MRFKTWILTYKYIDSPFGDLARDIENDKYFPNTNSYRRIKKHMQARGAVYEVLLTLAGAFRLYKNKVRNGSLYRWNNNKYKPNAYICLKEALKLGFDHFPSTQENIPEIVSIEYITSKFKYELRRMNLEVNPNNTVVYYWTKDRIWKDEAIKFLNKWDKQIVLVK